MSQRDTKQRILDSAERLIAEEGYHNTSLRAITCDAGVNLAAVNYHFGSKEHLVEEVFSRKLIPANKMRQERLAEVIENAKRENRRPEVKEILSTIIEPTIQFASSDSGQNFAKLVGRSLTEPEGTLRKYFLQFAEPMLKIFYDALCLALPDHSHEDIFYRMQFTLAAMGSTIRKIASVEVTTFGISISCEREYIVEKLIDYTAAGMEAP